MGKARISEHLAFVPMVRVICAFPACRQAVGRMQEGVMLCCAREKSESLKRGFSKTAKLLS